MAFINHFLSAAAAIFSLLTLLYTFALNRKVVEITDSDIELDDRCPPKIYFVVNNLGRRAITLTNVIITDSNGDVINDNGFEPHENINFSTLDNPNWYAPSNPFDRKTLIYSEHYEEFSYFVDVQPSTLFIRLEFKERANWLLKHKTFKTHLSVTKT
ncbi:hypothetical protein [Natribacillus halophilus]|nr:hypothetical protein [Natribacillus halophilus]